MRLRWWEALTLALVALGVIAFLWWRGGQEEGTPVDPRTGERTAPGPENPQPEDPPPEDPDPEDPDPEDPQPEDPDPDEPQPDDPQPEDPQPGDPDPDDPQPEGPQPEDPPPDGPKVDELLEQAKAEGDTVRALARLASAEMTPERAAMRAVLQYEVAALDAAVPDAHPNRDKIVAALEAAKGHRAVFDTVFAARRPAVDVLQDLRLLAADYWQEVALHALFPPTAAADAPRPTTVAGLPAEVDRAASWLGRTPRAEGETGAVLALEIAKRYESANRPRARLRWLRHAYEARGDSAGVMLEVIRGYVSQVLQREAFAVTGGMTDPGEEMVWRQRAIIAGWQSLPDEETEAWLKVPRAKLEGGYRERLLGLLTWRGRVDEALPYALDAARGGADDSQYERAIEIALKAGKVELGLLLLLEAAGRSKTPRTWRERFVNVALLDLRYDEAIAELKRLVKDYPEGRFRSLPGNPGYAERLESLLKAREMDAALIAHYEAELARATDTTQRQKLRQQLIDLHVLLGNRERAVALVGDAVEELTSVDEFLRLYPTARSFQVAELENRAVDLIKQGDDTAALRTRLYDVIQDRLDDAGRREVLTFLHRRHPAHGPIRSRLLNVLDRVDPVAAAALEEERATANPDNVSFTRAWVERAGWAQDAGSQLRARLALRRLVPKDGENLRQLGYLLGAAGRTDEAIDVWRELLTVEGPGSEAAENLAESLLLEKRYDEAIELLAGRARAEGAPRSARVRLAEAFAAAGRKDEALGARKALASEPAATREDKLALANLLLELELYGEARGVLEPMLEADPGDGHVLLRVAQSHAWEGAYVTAEEFLQRRVGLDVAQPTTQDRADLTEALFVLGEIRWGAQEKPAARRFYRRALARIQSAQDATRTERVIGAKIHGRLGNLAQARRMYDAVILEEPGVVDTRLDLVDTLIAANQVREARRTLDAARPLEPVDRRLRRMEAAVEMKEKRYESAVRRYRRIIDEGPATGSLHTDHATALREAGRYRDSAFAYVAAIRARAQSDWVRGALRDMRLQLGPLVSPRFQHRFAGGDQITRIGVSGHYALCGCDRITLGARVEHVDFEGERADIDAKVSDDFVLVAPQVRWRFMRRHELYAELEGYAGRARGPDAGLRVGVRFLDSDPYATLTLEARYDTLMEETGAAVPLGGAKRGVGAEGFLSLGDWWWVAGGITYDRIALNVPGAGRKADGWATWRAELGRRLTEGEPPLLSTRVLLSGSTHLDDRRLASVVPLGKRFDFLTGVVRLQERWKQVVDATFEVYAGLDLRADSFVWGAEGRLRLDLWRDFGLEVRSGYGNQDRYQDGESAHVDLRLDFIF